MLSNVFGSFKWAYRHNGSITTFKTEQNARCYHKSKAYEMYMTSAAHYLFPIDWLRPFPAGAPIGTDFVHA